MQGIINIEEPNYNKIHLNCSNGIVDLSLRNLSDYKFFDKDVVEWNDNNLKQIKSEVIEGKTIAGILFLKAEVKYGVNKRKVPYYLFKPLNWKYPNFLVASTFKEKKNLYVSIKYHKWERKIPYGMIDKIYGITSDYNAELEAVLGKYDLNFSNNEKVWKEPYEIPIDDLENQRKNFKEIAFSIDPEGCLDIDDAFHFKNNKDNIEIGIHIADVSRYVKPNGKIDLEAQRRLTSIYAPHKVINMLPSYLSEDICSLHHSKEKYSVSILLSFLKNGKLDKFEILPGIVKLDKNYSYQEADQIIITNNSDNQCDQELIQMFKFSKLIDPNITDTHQMVEYFMILANQLVCKFLKENDQIISNDSIIVRTHHKSEFDLSKENIPESLYNDIFYKFMNSATYSTLDQDSIHHALQIDGYTHFTSPIRRYVDIIIHRLIKSIWLNKNYDYNKELIEKINLRNQSVKKIERNIYFLKILQKLEGEEQLNVEGYITNIKNNFQVELYLPDYKLELESILYSSKLQGLIKSKINENKLTLQREDNIIDLEKYQKIKVRLIARDNEGYLHKKIWADIIEPNLDILI